MTMAHADLVFYVELRVKRERIEEWRRALDDIVEPMSKEAAFVACYLDQDPHDECRFTLYERWSEPSVEAFLANQMTPYRKAYDAKLPDLLQQPRAATILKPLREWHKQERPS
jgi:quinol monooxygenase YgiN